MGELLKGRVQLGEDEFVVEFDDIMDFLKSNYILHRETGIDYDLFYRNEYIKLDHDNKSFLELEEHIKVMIMITDMNLGGVVVERSC